MYIGPVGSFFSTTKRHPIEMGNAEVAQFLTHLAVQRNVAASTQNQALAAILFLYRAVLQVEVGWIKRTSVRAKTSQANANRADP